jgi:hypothetical protein
MTARAGTLGAGIPPMNAVRVVVVEAMTIG